MSLFGLVFIVGGMVALFAAKEDVPLAEVGRQLRQGGIVGLSNWVDQTRHKGQTEAPAQPATPGSSGSSGLAPNAPSGGGASGGGGGSW